MKISIILTEHEVQFNLEAESEHEKEFNRMLNKFGENGEVAVNLGVDLSMCQAGFVRTFGQTPNAVAITIRKREVPEVRNETHKA